MIKNALASVLLASLFFGCSKKIYNNDSYCSDNKCNGKYKFYDANKNISSVGKYKNGTRNGKWIYYNSYKEPARVLYYKNGASRVIKVINTKHR